MRAGCTSTLLAFGARHGFKEMNVTELKWLFVELDVGATGGGKRPVTEVSLVRALLFHCVPDATEADCDAALSWRRRVYTPGEVATTIADTNHMMDLVLEALDDEDLKQQLARFREARAAELSRRKQKDDELVATRSSSSKLAASSSAPASSAAARAPRGVPYAEQGYSAEAAKQWAPPGCVLSKETR